MIQIYNSLLQNECSESGEQKHGTVGHHRRTKHAQLCFQNHSSSQDQLHTFSHPLESEVAGLSGTAGQNFDTYILSTMTS